MSMSPTISVVAVDEELVKRYAEQRRAEGVSADSVVVSVLDMGGQSEFHAMLTFLMTPLAFYLLLFDMERLLPSAPPAVRAAEIDCLRRWVHAIVVGGWVLTRAPYRTVPYTLNHTHMHVYINTHMHMHRQTHTCTYTCM